MAAGLLALAACTADAWLEPPGPDDAPDARFDATPEPDAEPEPDADDADAEPEPDADADAEPEPDADAGDADAGDADVDVPPPDPATFVRYEGRFDRSVEGQARFAWSGSAIHARFEGSEIHAAFNAPGVGGNGGAQLEVLIDGVTQPKVSLVWGDQSYKLAEALPPGPHELELILRTEAEFGVVTFKGFSFGADAHGTLLEPAGPPPARHIEFVGDSFTCGYGVEGTVNPAVPGNCQFHANTEAANKTYAWRTARYFDASVNLVAWSGRGVVRNYGGAAGLKMPDLFEQLLPHVHNHPSEVPWPFAAPAPNAVVVFLGTNDFSPGSGNNAALAGTFEAGYAALLERLRVVYPEAELFGVFYTNGTSGPAGSVSVQNAVNVRRGAGDLRVHYVDLGELTFNGCQWHPNTLEQQAISERLVLAMQPVLGW